MSIFAKLVELEKAHREYALCTVVAVHGSTPRKPSAKMIVIDNQQPEGEIVGTLGGGAIEHLIRYEAVRLIKEKKTKLITTSLRNDLGMCCGGEMSVFIEPMIQKPRFICFGAGHIAQSLCPLAAHLGYCVVVADERTELLQKEHFSSCERLDCVSSLAFADDFFDASFIVIATHDHSLDHRIVESIIEKPFLYAALVGSQRKALMTKKRLQAKGFSEQHIGRLRVPAGLQIGAETPEEIALAIAAEMTLVKHVTSQNLRHDSSGRQKHAHGLSQGLTAYP